MNTVKNILWAALPILVLLAILDYFNLTGWFLFPVTTIKGKISGKTDPTVAAVNAPSQT
jgi:hypothetical protein